MNYVRSVWYSIFLLVLISCFIFPIVYAEQTTAITPASRELITSSAGSAPGREYIADQVIVRYNSKRFQNANIMSTSSASSNAKIGARVQKDFSDDGLSGMQLVTLPPNLSVEDAIAEYQKNPDVLYAEPNYIYYTAVTPNDPYYGNQWALYNTTHPGVDIAAPDAWGISTGSDSVVVAVVDTGIDYNHPDLAANIWNNIDEIPSNGIDDDGNGYIDDIRGWNFYGNTNDPMDGNTNDNTYHGTHCAGILGADGNNGIGVTGVNWEVKIMPLRVANESGSLTDADAIEAINYASANGADVISLSWGSDSDAQALKDAIDNSPAIVVCAAGNHKPGLDTDNFPFYPASFNSTNIISVGASDGTDARSWFSNYGIISVDLVAPGVSIFSTNISSANTTVSYQYHYMKGTSIATPFVAGVAALVKAENPRLTSTQIKNVILNNVDVLPSLSGEVKTGGRLNAYKAVLAAPSTGEPVQVAVFRPPQAAFYLKPGDYPTTDTIFTAWGLNTDLPITGDWNGDGKTEVGIYRPITATFYLKPNDWPIHQATVISYGTSTDLPITGDWNGDGITEVGVYRPSTATFYLRPGDYPTTGETVISYGTSTDLPITGDWNGDGKTEVGVYRPSTATFYLLPNDYPTTGATVIIYGTSADTPVTGDWNGDGITEVGVYRPSTATFYLRPGDYPSTDTIIMSWGIGTDLPVTGDWDGNGITDIGIFRPPQAAYYLRPSDFPTTDTIMAAWGLNTDLPITGDWNGDGKSEVGVYRPSTATFYLKPSDWPIHQAIVISYGTSTDLPVTGDWNGDGITEVGVYRPSTSTFYLLPSDYPTTGATVIIYGTSTDLPVTGDWNGDGITEVGYYRPSTATFYLRPSDYPTTSAIIMSWGIGTDLPVTGVW